MASIPVFAGGYGWTYVTIPRQWTEAQTKLPDGRFLLVNGAAEPHQRHEWMCEIWTPRNETHERHGALGGRCTLRKALTLFGKMMSTPSGQAHDSN